MWLENELDGFSRKGLAEIWEQVRTGFQQASCRGSSAAKSVGASGTVSPSNGILITTPPQPASRLSLEPLGSEKVPAGSIEVMRSSLQRRSVQIGSQSIGWDKRVSKYVAKTVLDEGQGKCTRAPLFRVLRIVTYNRGYAIYDGKAYGSKRQDGFSPPHLFVPSVPKPALQKSLHVMLVPEAFQTDKTQERSREANVSLEVAGQGFSAGGRGETSGSTSQQVS